jgi:hypothetical protein
VPVGSIVHDTASITGDPAVTGFAVDGTVTFTLYNSSDCNSNQIGNPQTVNVGPNTADGTRSADTLPLAAGQYGYQATYNGNGNYNGSPGVCEPFSVYTLGKTMGYWGNTNGQAAIGTTAVNISPVRGANIDTQAESLKVLPSALNACGKGITTIFTGQTKTIDCTVANGINKGSLNTLSAQTLALGYNKALVTGYNGQTIGQLQCQAVTGLNNGSTVQQAFDKAVSLIDNSALGGSTKQGDIGAMNTLLGCLNREA